MEWSRHITGIHPRPLELAGRGSGVDLTGPGLERPQAKGVAPMLYSILLAATSLVDAVA